MNLTREDERELIAKAKNNDAQALDAICRGTARFALFVMKRHVRLGSSMDMDDCFAEAMFGVLEAIQSYDLDSPVRFTTFAAHYVKRRSIIFRDWLNTELYVPRNNSADYVRLSKYLDLVLEFGAGMNADVPVSKHVRVRDVGVPIPIATFEEEDRDIVAVSDNDVSCFAHESDADTLLELCNHFLMKLTKRDRRAFALYYGIPHGEPLTLGDVGKVLGITREGVRLIILNIRRKMDADAVLDSKTRELINYLSKNPKTGFAKP